MRAGKVLCIHTIKVPRMLQTLCSRLASQSCNADIMLPLLQQGTERVFGMQRLHRAATAAAHDHTLSQEQQQRGNQHVSQTPVNATQRQQAPPAASIAGLASALSSSSSQQPTFQMPLQAATSTHGTATAKPHTDLFTQALQQKTEQELAELVAKARDRQLADTSSQSSEEEEEEDTGKHYNASTGEWYGPKGKEPTRYGDWELKGRCTDF